jgi:CheY-like chemotaxis protein
MPEATAFLSYTRTDDEFYGGYITSFRKTFENAVHVVTGEKTFRVFQDIDGIVVGENWRKKLSEAIEASSFLVPMLTPLFFNSTFCRDEVEQFLEHERSLDREDLILPVYFFTSPRLEKQEERDADPIAAELSRRQPFDWRERADIPLDQPLARQAIIALARQVAQRLKSLGDLANLGNRGNRGSLGGPKAAPAAAPTGPSPAPAAGNAAAPAPRGDGAFAHDPLATSPALGAGIDGRLTREVLDRKTILWVDDNPDNNIAERRALGSYAMQFVLARSTAQAEGLLDPAAPFAAIISDMGREGDREAGLALLGRLRETGVETPYFMYTTRTIATTLGPVARERGARGITGDPDELVEMVVAATRRATPSA